MKRLTLVCDVTGSIGRRMTAVIGKLYISSNRSVRKTTWMVLRFGHYPVEGESLRVNRDVKSCASICKI